MSGIDNISPLGGTPDEASIVAPVAAATAFAQDRRRPGRLQTNNANLIGLLRQPTEGPPPDAADPAPLAPPLGEAEGPKPSLLPLVAAAAGFWGVVVAYIWLI